MGVNKTRRSALQMRKHLCKVRQNLEQGMKVQQDSVAQKIADAKKPLEDEIAKLKDASAQSKQQESARISEAKRPLEEKIAHLEREKRGNKT